MFKNTGVLSDRITKPSRKIPFFFLGKTVHRKIKSVEFGSVTTLHIKITSR
jgi:hypothetical protein